MTNDELKDIWARQSEGGVILTPEKVWRLARASERFERTIFWRDAREWIATLVVEGFLFAFILSQATVHWLLVGAAILVCLPTTYATLLRRKRPDPNSYRSLTDHLRESIARVQHQIGLLGSVHWWYLAPLALSMLLVFVDRRQWERGLAHTLFFVGFGIILYAGIWKLNQHAVRTELVPRLRKLEGTLGELESDSQDS
ncbi:MAG: hypothetical protein ABI540_06695 [Spartobacteria bacterium]